MKQLKVLVITDDLNQVNRIGEYLAAIAFVSLFLSIVALFLVEYIYSSIMTALFVIDALLVIGIVILVVVYLFLRKKIYINLADILAVSINAKDEKVKQNKYAELGHFLTVVSEGKQCQYEVPKLTLILKILPHKTEDWEISYDLKKRPMPLASSLLFLFAPFSLLG